jgi:hypothetical protein
VTGKRPREAADAVSARGVRDRDRHACRPREALWFGTVVTVALAEHVVRDHERAQGASQYAGEDPQQTEGGVAFLAEARALRTRARLGQRGVALRPMRLFHWSISYLRLLFVVVGASPFPPGPLGS